MSSEWTVADRYFNHAGYDPDRKEPEPLPVGVPIPLGGVPWPSNDEGIEYEIRAAELAIKIGDKCNALPWPEAIGFANFVLEHLKGDGHAPKNQDELVGWLAGEIWFHQ